MTLDNRTIEKLRGQLDDRRSELAEQLEKSMHSAFTGEFDSSERGGVDRGDESVASMEADLNRAAVSRAEQELKAIDLALRKIENGDYGRCQSCGEDIESKRLSANPAAALCVACQEKSEDDRDERDQTPSL